MYIYKSDVKPNECLNIVFKRNEKGLVRKDEVNEPYRLQGIKYFYIDNGKLYIQFKTNYVVKQGYVVNHSGSYRLKDITRYYVSLIPKDELP